MDFTVLNVVSMGVRRPLSFMLFLELASLSLEIILINILILRPSCRLIPSLGPVSPVRTLIVIL